MKPYNVIIILGPTASGKTRLAAHASAIVNGEIISADSRQVYRNMNIGTGKDLNEYNINGTHIPYHLIDIADAGASYNLDDYISDFHSAFISITSKNKMPVLCGGTGLYIDAVVKGFEFTNIPVDEELRIKLNLLTHEELKQQLFKIPSTPFHQLADTTTVKRTIRAIEIAEWLNKNPHNKITIPQLKPLTFGLDPGRQSRRMRIENRLKERLENGLIQEVENLLKAGVTKEKLIYYGLEYKFVVMYLDHKMSYDYLVEHLTIAIKQFAKRQMTYFRKMEREGLQINWIDAGLNLDEQLEALREKL